MTARLGRELLTVRHGVTRFRITMVCFEAEYLRGEFHSPFYAAGRWIEPEQLGDYPLSTAQRRLARAVRQPPPPLLFP